MEGWIYGNSDIFIHLQLVPYLFLLALGEVHLARLLALLNDRSSKQVIADEKLCFHELFQIRLSVQGELKEQRSVEGSSAIEV